MGELHMQCRTSATLILQRGSYVEHEEWIWAGVYTLLSMITRYWRIGAANYVVWDEVSTLSSAVTPTDLPKGDIGLLGSVC